MVKMFASYANRDPDSDRWNSGIYNKNLTHSWNFLTGEEVEVTCYTNCASTELFLNGKSLGVKDVNNTEEYYLTWIVPYEKGELKAVSIDEAGNAYEDVLITSGAAVGIRMDCVDEEIIGNGLDMTHVLLDIIGRKYCE